MLGRREGAGLPAKGALEEDKCKLGPLPGVWVWGPEIEYSIKKKAFGQRPNVWWALAYSGRTMHEWFQLRKGHKEKGSRVDCASSLHQTFCLEDAAPGNQGRAQAQRYCPKSVHHRWPPRGILNEHFFQNIVCKANRDTHLQLPHSVLPSTGQALFATWIANIMNSIVF